MPSEDLRRLVAPHANDIGGPITALRAVQQYQGWIDDEAVATVADVFNLSRADVRGLVHFYADLRTRPPADHIVRICQAEACQATGSRALTKTLEERLGVGLGQATPDRRVEFEAVYCLGLCARAPSAMVDHQLVAEADKAVDRIVERVRA